MVMPIGDDNTGRRLTPIVNYVLIGLNVFVFVVFQKLGQNIEFTFAFSTVPREIVTGEDIVTGDQEVQDPVTEQVIKYPGLQKTPVSVYITLLTSLFMHGGFLHLFGNLLFLWIFGDNVEDTLGHWRYLLFYLVCGILASLAHVLATVALEGANSEAALIPSLGASGAISGVLGGYLLLHPQRRVWVLFLRFPVQVPAYVAIGIWFLFQLISGLGMFGGGSQKGGVAYAAHVGGFLAGLALVKLFAIGREPEVHSPPIQRRWYRV